MKNYEDFLSACSYLLENFSEAEEARQYLDQRVSRKTQKKFGLGYHPTASEYQSLLSQISEEYLIDLKLRFDRLQTDGLYQKVRSNYFEHYQIVMPYRNLYGQIEAVVGRTLLSPERQSDLSIAKYKNTSFEKKNHVFGLFEGKNQTMKENVAFLTEGQFDVMSAHDIGIQNVMAVGSSGISGIQLSLISRYCSEIFIILDNDEAGIAGTERAVAKFGKSLNLYPRKIPEGFKDLDDLFKAVPNLKSKDLQNLEKL